MGGRRGLTLLEVVIALMLFALLSVMLLSGLGAATEATERAQVERDIAELLQFRLNVVALEHDEYEDGDEGEFPASGASTRLVDEQAKFGDRYAGYRWYLEMRETIGSGSTGAATVAGGDPLDLLFAEEGGGGGEVDSDEAEENELEAEQVERLLFIRVTVYPPEYEERPIDEEDVALRPRSAWTAIYLAPDQEEG